MGALVAVLLVPGVPSVADAPPDVSSARAEVLETSAQLREVNARLESVQARLEVVRAEAARARRDQRAAEVRYDVLTSQVVDLQRSVAAAEAQMVTTRSAITSAERSLAVVVREMYATGPLSELAIVLQTDEPSDMMDRLAAVDAVADHHQQALQELEALRVQITTQIQAHADRVDVLRGKQAEASVALADAERQSDRADQASREVTALLLEQRGLARDLRTELRADEQRYAALRRAAEQLRRSYGASGPAAPGQSGVLSRPVPGGVASPFGMRTHPITGEYKLHTGVDLQASCGTPIRAAADGVVVQAGYDTAYGYRSVLDHGRPSGVSLVTTYNHQTRLAVRNGERVARGEVIGYAGTTGYSTGCHLHFETLANGRFSNPLDWM